jgi:hypothetical protein
MNSVTKKNNLQIIQILALSAFVVFALFVWQGNKQFNLWDEGFLWYGVQRVMLGEVPIRDFMAYDPGRYYWSAMLMSVFGDRGIMSLRAAAAAFQALGLFVGLLLVARSLNGGGKTKLLFLIISAFTLSIWMVPYQRAFDISVSIFLIGTLAFLIDKPSTGRYFVAGICVGLAAFFGRNHGIYGVAGSLGVMVWLRIKPSEGPGFIKGFIIWAAGVIVGFAPIPLMALLVPGFAAAFWESVRFLFDLKATNLPKPVPWPWTVNFSTTPLNEALRGVLAGIFFIGILVFAGVATLWVLLQKFKEKPVPPALVASAFLALPYAQYAYSRADGEHLALGIYPLLVGCLALLATKKAKIKWPLALMLCAASIWLMYILNPGGRCQISKECVNVDISGSKLLVDPSSANEIALLRKLAHQYAPNGQSFIATPFWPGAYALLERRSPMWEIYALFPRPKSFEQKELERIRAAAPRFALVFDAPLDGREELRFRNTHPLINQYILNNFDLLPDSPDPAYHIYKAKRGDQ